MKTLTRTFIGLVTIVALGANLFAAPGDPLLTNEKIGEIFGGKEQAETSKVVKIENATKLMCMAMDMKDARTGKVIQVIPEHKKELITVPVNANGRILLNDHVYIGDNDYGFRVYEDRNGHRITLGEPKVLKTGDLGYRFNFGNPRNPDTYVDGMCFTTDD